MKSYFITGTDTGVGKTHVTALLLTELRRRGINAVAFKPIACGSGGRRDAKIYRAILDGKISLDQLNPVYLNQPLAPSVAAKIEGAVIDLRKIVSAYRRLAAQYEVVLVEGAGGLLVPIKRDYFVADLAKDLGLPLIIVARLGLGTINHTLLTVREAKAFGLEIAGIILNATQGGARGLAEQTNIKAVPQLTRVPLLGVTPHGKQRATVAKVVRGICDRLL